MITSKYLRPVCIVLVILGLSNAVGCRDQPQATYGAQDSRINVEAAAHDISIDVGNVGKISTDGRKGTVFVFEEYHTSRVGQLQIAIMLLRLRDKYGLRMVALEGAVQAPRPLPAQWFHTMGGETAREAREDVAIRMLAEGEISSAEFLALLSREVEVYGAELQAEYDVKLDIQRSPEFAYLFAIAKKKLTQSQIIRANELISNNKQNEAIEYILNSDPWVRERYESLKKGPGSSIEEMVTHAREIKRKAREVGVEPEIEEQAKQDMDNAIAFFEAGAKRTQTMVDFVLGLESKSPGSPLAVIIGAAHTSRTLKLLQFAGVSFAQLTPTALNPDFAMLSDEQFDRKNSQKWVRTSVGTLGHLLNAKRKPPPIIGQTTAKSCASLNLAALLVARANRAGRPVPEAIWSEIGALPELEIDRDSFTQEGNETIFRAWGRDTNSQRKEIWVRVAALDTPNEARTVEEKLFQAIADLGGGGKLPPRDPPPNSSRSDDEGPGDGKRDGVILNRIGPREVAVFAASQGDVKRIKISG